MIPTMSEEVFTLADGAVTQVLVLPGDEVRPGDVLFEMDTAEGPLPHHCDRGGTVCEVLLESGQEKIEAGTLAVIVD